MQRVLDGSAPWWHTEAILPHGHIPCPPVATLGVFLFWSRQAVLVSLATCRSWPLAVQSSAPQGPLTHMSHLTYTVDREAARAASRCCGFTARFAHPLSQLPLASRPGSFCDACSVAKCSVCRTPGRCRRSEGVVISACRRRTRHVAHRVSRRCRCDRHRGGLLEEDAGDTAVCARRMQAEASRVRRDLGGQGVNTMDKAKLDRLRAAGWRSGDAADFLGLSEEKQRS